MSYILVGRQKINMYQNISMITHNKNSSILRFKKACRLSLLFIVVCLNCANHDLSSGLFSFHYDHSLPLENIALIIPGMNQTSSDKGYNSIGRYYKNRGITPVYIDINWKSVGVKRLSAASAQIDSMLRYSFTGSNIYLFGFSFGAVIALKVSQLTIVKQILLCSMSPLFNEDRQYQIFPFKQLMGLLMDYQSNGLFYSSIQRKCIYFLYGDHDSFIINKNIIRHRESFFNCNKTLIVKNAKHSISGISYLNAIRDVVNGIER